MTGVAKIGSISTGHDRFPPRPIISGSNNVFINSVGASKIGDAWAVHCNDSSCHNCNQATGSSSVFVNGVGICCIGMSTGCGDSIATGSLDTFAG